jgi:hypothetical protein
VSDSISSIDLLTIVFGIIYESDEYVGNRGGGGGCGG